jgi:predicted N-formylglutamate amidohydrolase
VTSRGDSSIAWRVTTSSSTDRAVRDVHVVMSCEHAGNRVPARYASLFSTPAARKALESHRGWDPGAGALAGMLARRLGAPLVAQDVSRLLVECNRSADHPRLWSEFSRGLTDEERRQVVRRYWSAHRNAVRAAVAACPPGLVVHVGVHTFTPVWRGRSRSTQVGLLFDPARPLEAELVARWKKALDAHPVTQALAVHRNRPYRGWTDGLTTTLRSELPDHRYAGIELEVSQALIPTGAELSSALADTLLQSLGPDR